jgi:TrmH family RNA methyltransferase
LRLIEELINSNYNIKKIWTTDNFLNDHPGISDNIKDSDYSLIDEKYFDQILNTQHPQHIMALLPINEVDTQLKLSNKNVLILDEISDPGNMGSLLRSAAWYGIDSVLCSTNCVDIYNPKVIRSAMGAHFHISNLIHIDLIDTINMLKTDQYHIIGASLEGVHYKKMKVDRQPWALILGNEAHGINRELYKMIDQKISIPQRGPIQSLNVAIAGSILLDRLIHD